MNEPYLLPNDGESCLRLRNKDGVFLSLMVCGADQNGETSCVDLCEPSGEVLYCDVPKDLVNALIEHLGLEKI